MAPFKFYIDVPVNHSMYQQIAALLLKEKQIIADSMIDADFVVRPLGFPTWTAVEKLILVGDFSISQAVPSRAVCVDFKTGMVEMPAGMTRVSWHYYLKEFLRPVWAL